MTVTRLDRLARSTRDLITTLAAITGKDAGFRALADAWADTTALRWRELDSNLRFPRRKTRRQAGEALKQGSKTVWWGVAAVAFVAGGDPAPHLFG